MAYPCKIWLKNECDGCGWCEEQRHGYSMVGAPFADDDEYDPFEIDHDDER